MAPDLGEWLSGGGRSVWWTERAVTKKTRRRIDARLKAKIALEALREQATVTDLAQRSRFTPTMLGR